MWIVLTLLWLVWLAVKFVLWLVGALLFSLWWMQTRLLYLPSMPEMSSRKLEHNEPGFRSPRDFDLDFEDLHVVTRDGVRIHGWLVRPSLAVLKKLAEGQDPRFQVLREELAQRDPSTSSLPSLPSFVFCHGNAGNCGFRLPNVANLVNKCGCNVVIFDYRGYGNSEGRPSERGLLLDAEAVVDRLLERPDIDPRRIYVFGRSLGGAVAIGLAERLARRPQFPLRGLLLENTFTDVPDMALVLLRQVNPDWISRPLTVRLIRAVLWFAVTDRWSSLERVASLRCDQLFLSGRRDELVPPLHMDRLYELARSSAGGSSPPHKVDIFQVEGGQHNDTHIVGGAAYFERIRAFLWESSAK